MGGHAFLLIADNRLGYVLQGDRDVLSRHTDEQVEIAGLVSNSRSDIESGSALQPQPPKPSKKTEKSQEKKATPELSLPGFFNVQVSSLTTIAHQCARITSVQ
jgi:hypothetical protein